MNWSYIAGFFDGEGNISIKRRVGRRPQVVLNMTQKRREVLDEILLFLESQHITAHVYKKTSCFYIQIGQAQSCRPFLEAVVSTLIVKKEEAEIGLATLHKQPQSRTKLSTTEKNTIAELRKAGKSYAYIGKQLNRDSSNIFRFVKRLGQGVLAL